LLLWILSEDLNHGPPDRRSPGTDRGVPLVFPSQSADLSPVGGRDSLWALQGGVGKARSGG
jgi:hypothetical protein